MAFADLRQALRIWLQTLSHVIASTAGGLATARPIVTNATAKTILFILRSLLFRW
jgi:hypothetical protein